MKNARTTVFGIFGALACSVALMGGCATDEATTTTCSEATTCSEKAACSEKKACCQEKAASECTQKEAAQN